MGIDTANLKAQVGVAKFISEMRHDYQKAIDGAEKRHSRHRNDALLDQEKAEIEAQYLEDLANFAHRCAQDIRRSIPKGGKREVGQPSGAIAAARFQVGKISVGKPQVSIWLNRHEGAALPENSSNAAVESPAPVAMSGGEIMRCSQMLPEGLYRDAFLRAFVAELEDIEEKER